MTSCTFWRKFTSSSEGKLLETKISIQSESIAFLPVDFEDKVQLFSPLLNDNYDEICSEDEEDFLNPNSENSYVELTDAFDDIDRALKRYAIPARIMTETANSDSASNIETDSVLSFKHRDIPAFISQNGQLKLAVHVNQGLLTVHVIQARQLKSATCGEKCNSYVQVKLVPEGGKQKNCETEVVYDTNRPVFEDKFSFEMDREAEKKRLSISTHHKTTDGCSEFLGCMSFGVKHLLSKGKDVSGWYHLLPESIGKRKHILVQQHPYAYIANKSIPKINKALEGMETITVAIKKGSAGYGFSVVGGCPVKVGRVDAGSPAAAAGLQRGDLIVSINGKNVSRSTNDSVAKIVKSSQKQIILDINRKIVECEDKENKAPSKRPLPQRPMKAPSTPGDVTYEQLMSPLSCPLDPPPAPVPGYHRTLTEGRLLNTYIEPLSSEQSRQNYELSHQCASKSDRFYQDSVSRTLCDSDMPPPLPTRNYTNMSLSSVDTQDLQSVSQQEQPHNVTMVSVEDDTVDRFSDFSSVSEMRKISGPWTSKGALDLWPSSIEIEEDSGDESCDSAEYAFLEDATECPEDQDNSTDSCDQLSTRHDFTVSFKEVPGFDQELHSALEHLVDCEARYIQDMSLGVQLFSRPLRHCIISHTEHKQLFQNIEKLVTISEYHLSQITATLQPGSSYKQRVSLLCDAYVSYIGGLRQALELLHQLVAYPEFKQFLASAEAKLPAFSIEAFLERPVQHFKHLSDNLDAVLASTSKNNEDFCALNEVANTLHKSCRKIFSSHSSSRSAASVSSKASRSSQRSRSSTRSQRSCQSTSSQGSIDSEVLDIQNRLAASKDSQEIHLAVPNRHMIYNGELMLVKGTRWVKAWCVLLSDMLLLTRVEPSGHLSPLEAPLLLSDISAIETTLHPSELVLVGHGRSSQPLTLTLRATTLEQKCVWKNLVEQRVGVCKSQSDAMSCYMSDTFI